MIQFNFLGYTFRPRKVADKYGRGYVNFSPAVSREALRMMCQAIRSWRIQLKNNKELKDLFNMFNPILRGWWNYYGRFHGSAMAPVWQHMNAFLFRWLKNKYKHLSQHRIQAQKLLRKLAASAPMSFVHWNMGYCSAWLNNGSRMS